MTIPSVFDDIRPYTPEEMSGIFDALHQDEKFRSVVAQIMPGIPFDSIIAKAHTCKTALDFQKLFLYPILKENMQQYTDGADMDANSLDKSKNYTFISNHRDIVLDSAYLSKLMLDCGFNNTVEIAIGDNLLAYPWIEYIVRLNKSFIVKRSLTIRQQLVASKQLSDYIHFAISQKVENVWIAQREGRAKDSNDRTQLSILKMMSLGGDGNITQKLKQLHIVPLSISYEFDPCDFLKAKELQQKRDNPAFHKTHEEDVISMRTGILGYKGHVHYQAAACIDSWLDKQPTDRSKNEFFSTIATHIDHEIHSHYRLYANNYIAYDRFTDGSRFDQLYTTHEKKRFDEYIAHQISRIDLPNADHDYLQHMLLTMYANPLINYLKAAETKEK